MYTQRSFFHLLMAYFHHTCFIFLKHTQRSLFVSFCLNDNERENKRKIMNKPRSYGCTCTLCYVHNVYSRVHIVFWMEIVRLKMRVGHFFTIIFIFVGIQIEHTMTIETSNQIYLFIYFIIIFLKKSFRQCSYL